MSEPTLDLSALILGVRKELEKADVQMRVAGKPTLFQLSSMELELHFVVKTSSEVKGGFDLKIVSLGSKLAEAGEEVQKVKVKFEVPPEAIKAQVTGSRFFDEGGAKGQRSKPVTPLK